jgi:protein-S-isoprenylcysteine O-methyltransferase Ste14
MGPHEHAHLAGEMPRSHDIQTVLMALFLATWAVDSFLLRLTTFLSAVLPIWYSAIPALVVFALSIYFMRGSHRVLFDTRVEGLVTHGAFGRVRHPMYLGTVLVYLALAIATLSLASLVLWFVILACYNRLANYEEMKLEERFGQAFLEYRKTVRKWLPF